MKKFKHFGPFSCFYVKDHKKNFITAWLSSYPDEPFGWEWGTDGEYRNPSYCIRLGHFDVVSYEGFRGGGFTIRLLGFWWVR